MLISSSALYRMICAASHYGEPEAKAWCSEFGVWQWLNPEAASGMREVEIVQMRRQRRANGLA